MPQLLQLARVLHRAERFDGAGPGDDVDATVPQKIRVGEAQVRRLDADPPAREPLGECRQDRARRLLERHAVDVARRLCVAEVGVEGRLPRGIDEDRRVRADEAGQVADVDEARDEERLVQAAREALDPRHPFLRSASRPSACRYPSIPSPITRPVGSPSRTVCRRQSSRASMSEMWTSTTGPANGSSASRIAQL